MPLDVREVHRVAALARLRLDAGQERRFAEQLQEIVEYIDRIRALAGAPQAAAAGAPSREASDRPAPCLERERFLANAPATEGPFLVVPQVIGSGDA
jgi:aspartyl/glutamyl-tRNA(Asn/Gln) amidotransferase C subunit